MIYQVDEVYHVIYEKEKIEQNNTVYVGTNILVGLLKPLFFQGGYKHIKIWNRDNCIGHIVIKDGQISSEGQVSNHIITVVKNFYDKR